MKFLKNGKNLSIMPVLYLVVTAVFYCLMLSDMAPVFAIESIVEIITILLLFAITVAYKQKENNMMKTLMGALLMERVFFAFGTFVRMLSEEGSVLATVTGVIYLFLYVLFFIVHISIDIKDANASGKIATNTVIGVLIVVVLIILMAGTTKVVNGPLSFASGALMEVFMVIELLCIERNITY